LIHSACLHPLNLACDILVFKFQISNFKFKFNIQPLHPELLLAPPKSFSWWGSAG
jgi:hypothetical protein